MRPLILSLSCLAVVACGGAKEQAARTPPVVTAAAVGTARFVDRIDAVGTARAREQVTLAAPMTERIVRINFQDGGLVRAGQVIAVLAQGQQTAALASAQARAQEAGQQLARLEELKRRGFATNALVDTQTASAASARALAAEARATIGDRVIRAPFTGFASLRMISAGAVVTAGTEIATISDISQIKLDFPVPETMLSALAVGQPIAARAAAFPGEPFRGTIATVDPVIDSTTRAVMVRAILPNPRQRLKPGMLMTVAVESRPRTAPAVPELAVVGEGDARFVYRVERDGTVKRVPVRIGAREVGRVEVIEGLAPGQKIVVEGMVKVSDGMKVRLAGPANAAPAARAPAPAVAR
ncbi:MAG: family efflux transporter subunit [Sphingomonas bacterium]|nr:family efflux transporter subunit [Sphingomonas bacterium]